MKFTQRWDIAVSEFEKIMKIKTLKPQSDKEKAYEKLETEILDEAKEEAIKEIQRQEIEDNLLSEIAISERFKTMDKEIVKLELEVEKVKNSITLLNETFIQLNGIMFGTCGETFEFADAGYTERKEKINRIMNDLDVNMSQYLYKIGT